jgi:hypothetical protein
MPTPSTYTVYVHWLLTIQKEETILSFFLKKSVLTISRSNSRSSDNYTALKNERMYSISSSNDGNFVTIKGSRLFHEVFFSTIFSLNFFEVNPRIFPVTNSKLMVPTCFKSR